MSDRVATCRRTWFLWFALLAAPGSGFLRMNGLPFSSKTEFAIVAVSIILLANPSFRSRLRNFLSQKNWRIGAWVNFVLAILILLKFVTFAIAPLGGGFEACYRSIYKPLPDLGACEKSYEAPFLNRDNVNGLNQITRMERRLSFGRTGDWINGGASHTTWNLPFANDYPRFEDLWLDRLPFTVKFGSEFTSRRDSFLPVQFVGEARVSIDDQVSQAVSYRQPTIILAPVSPGRKKFIVDFKFADLDTAEIPSQQPPISGPWAQLFVGRPTTLETLEKTLTLNLRGWSIDRTNSRAPIRYEIRSAEGGLIFSTASVAREDVAKFVGSDVYKMSGFDFSVKEVGLPLDGRSLDFVAIYSDNDEVLLAKLSHSAESPLNVSQVVIEQFSPAEFEAAWFSLDVETAPTLRPVPSEKTNLLFDLTVNVIDYLVVGVALLMLGFVGWRQKRDASVFLVCTLGFLLIQVAISRMNFQWWGYRQAMTPLLIGTTIGLIGWTRGSRSLLVGLSGAVVAISSPMITLVRNFGGLERADWWGFQIFRGRDSDWLAYQGYAKTIFDSGSLQGGESVFRFQGANRYFIFVQHLLFGENDVLLGIIVGIGVILCGIFVAREAARVLSDYLVAASWTLFVIAIFILMSEEVMQTFAHTPASELIAMALIMLGFALLSKSKITIGIAYLITILAGLISQFRAEQVFGAVLLFILLQVAIHKNSDFELLLKLRLAFAFAFITSLSLLHNLYYGGSFTFFTNSNSSFNYDFTFLEMLNFFGDERIREVVFLKLKMIFVLSFPLQPLEIAFLIFHLLWLAALFIATKKKNRDTSNWLALIFPFVFLLPLLPYEIVTYFPRRILATQIAFGVSGLFVIGRIRSISSRVDDLAGEVGHIRADSVHAPLD